MALKKLFIYQPESLDVQLPEAYHRIMACVWRANGSKRVVFHVNIYPDKIRRDNGAQPMFNIPQVYELDSITDENAFSLYFSNEALSEAGKTIISQAYEYLKTLPEYSGSEDI